MDFGVKPIPQYDIESSVKVKTKLRPMDQIQSTGLPNPACQPLVQSMGKTSILCITTNRL